MVKKYEFYPLTAQRGEEIIEFRVRGTSHTQHVWNKTHINGLAKSAANKIRGLKQAGYRVYTVVGDRVVKVEN
jgi:hypothetical protein